MMTEVLDLSAGRVVRTGDPGHANASRLAGAFVIACGALGADSSEVGAALGAAIATLWCTATDAEFAQVLGSIRDASLGNRALQAQNAAKQRGRKAS